MSPASVPSQQPSQAVQKRLAEAVEALTLTLKKIHGEQVVERESDRTAAPDIETLAGDIVAAIGEVTTALGLVKDELVDVNANLVLLTAATEANT